MKAMPFTRRTVSLVVLAVAVISAPAQLPAGHDRWAVRTGTDRDVSTVHDRPNEEERRTVEDLARLPRPGALPLNQPSPAFQDRRIPPVETTTYRVEADIIGYQRESDGSYSIVIQGTSGATMIVGLPLARDVGTRWRTQVEDARGQFERHFHGAPPGSVPQRARVHATIRGVGFFDQGGDRAGAAPNGITLQPVLGLSF
jgi:hypothetical protein